MYELGADVGKANANVHRFAPDRGIDQPQERLVEMRIVARNLGPNSGGNARRQESIQHGDVLARAEQAEIDLHEAQRRWHVARRHVQIVLWIPSILLLALGMGSVNPNAWVHRMATDPVISLDPVEPEQNHPGVSAYLHDLAPAVGVAGPAADVPLAGPVRPVARNAIVPSFSDAMPADLATKIEACAPADERCAAFVEGNGPKRGAFLASMPDGSKAWLSRFAAWREMRCMAYAAWAEARSEGPDGMLAVMQVFRHRAASEEHPGSICAVIAERGQFEAMLAEKSRPWLMAAKDPGKMVPAFPDKLKGPDAGAANNALVLAWRLMTGQVGGDLIDGATFFATIGLIKAKGTDTLAPNLKATLVLKNHMFFRQAAATSDDPRFRVASRL